MVKLARVEQPFLPLEFATTDYGFVDSHSGMHTSRTMMFVELDALMSALPEPLSAKVVREAILTENILGKATYSGRRNSANKLIALYGFTESPLYAIFEMLYRASTTGRPALALLMALCRDGVLREVLPLLLNTAPGEPLGTEQVNSALLASEAVRFTEKTRRSTTRNILGSLRAAGFISRSQPTLRTAMVVDTQVITFAVLIAWMRGLRADDILASPYMLLLRVDSAQVTAALRAAHRAGLLNSRLLGDVVDLSPGPALQEILGT